jgi:hypothetical protein
MPYAKLTITVPESVWIGDISRTYADTRFRVLAATANDSTGVARIRLIGSEPEAVCETMCEYDAVADLTVFETDPNQYRIQVETTKPLLLTSLQASGVPIETPFEVSDGEMVLETTIPQHRLSKLGEQLDEFGISFSVEQIKQEFESDALLTTRQQSLLYEAIDHGYYDTPRQITLTELSNELDMAASTCCEVLHRAEEQVLKKHVQEAREIEHRVPASAD